MKDEQEQRQPPEQRKGDPKGGRPPKEPPPRDPPVDCSDCTIDAMTESRNGGPARRIVADTDTQYALSRVAEDTTTVTLTAEPSDPDCPCVFGDRINLEFIRIHTGLANQTREQLFRMPQLVQVDDTGIDSNPDHVVVAGCSITVSVSRINQDMRAGNMSGVQFNLKAVPLRLAGRVRCNGTWRKFVIEFTDD